MLKRFFVTLFALFQLFHSAGCSHITPVTSIQPQPVIGPLTIADMLNTSTVAENRDTYSSILKTILIENENVLFFDSSLYSDKMSHNYDDYRLFNYLLIQTDILHVNSSRNHELFKQINHMLITGDLLLTFENILYLISLDECTDIPFLSRQTLREESLNVLSKMFDNNTGLFYEENCDIEAQIYLTNQALRIMHYLEIPCSMFENLSETGLATIVGFLNLDTLTQNMLLYLTAYENIILIENISQENLPILHKQSIYSDISNQLNNTSIIDIFKDNNGYMIEVLSVLNRLDMLSCISLNETQINQLYESESSQVKTILSKSIGFEYRKLDLLSTLGITPPSQLQQLLGNYEIYLYSTLPTVILEEQFYGLLLLKNLQKYGSTITFDEEKFLSTCVRTLEQENNIRSIYYVYQIASILQADEIINQLGEKYLTLSIDKQNIPNLELAYFCKILDATFGRDTSSAYSPEKLNTCYSHFVSTPENYSDRDFYYLTLLSEQQIQVENPLEYSEHIIDSFFKNNGFSSTTSDPNPNTYSTYRFLALATNGLIQLNPNTYSSCKKYLDTVRDPRGFYTIQHVTLSETASSFTLKSWCMGIGIEHIISNYFQAPQ